jgi:outer membrane biosynthesis protein TonB
MEAQEKNRRRKALAITIVFHAVVTLLFLFFGLKQPNPLPEEQGASIEFGWDANATASVVESQVAATPQPIPTPVPPTEAKEDEVATQDDSEVAVTPQKETKKPKDPKPKEPVKPKEESRPKEDTKPKEDPKPAEEPKPQISQQLSNALGQLGQGGGQQGNTQGEGAQGNQQGSTGGGGSGSGTSGSGTGLLGGGGSWDLAGRSMMPGYGTKISTTKEEGIVVLNIQVDRSGKVVSATPNLRESNTTSQYLINLAINDVLNNFRFNADPNAAIEQRGRVRYVFRLQ